MRERVLIRTPTARTWAAAAKPSFFAAVTLALMLPAAVPCQAQFLQRKAQETSDPAASPSRVDGSWVASLEADDIDEGEIPPWEHRLFRALDTIDAAIAEAERSVAKLDDIPDNPLIEEDAKAKIRADFIEAVGTPSISVCTKLAEITPGKSINRHQQYFLLTLESPDFPGHRYRMMLKVAISPTDARRLRIGSTVRLDGQLMQKSRKAFDTIHFFRLPGERPLPGSQQLGVASVASAAADNAYVFPFHVENAQMLNGPRLDEYQEFRSRYDRVLSAIARERSDPSDE